MKNPIRTAVQDFLQSGRAPFHMPGHKGRASLEFGGGMDITEVEGADSLYQAQGCIKQCEDSFSQLLGTAGSFISAGGSTLCIQTMLALAAHGGSKIIAGRMIHSSAVAAMALLGLEPVWIFTPAAKRGIAGLSLPVSAEQVENSLQRHPDAAAVYITSPDYFGQVADIAAISQVCKRYNTALLVDNAHGAHLDMFGMHPARLGADMCCDSLHKSLPVLTGGAILHVMDEGFASVAKECMAMFGSTSPNYLIMMSIEASLGEFGGDMPQRYHAAAAEFSALRVLALSKGFELPESCEPLHLTLGYSRCGYDDNAFGQYIRSCGIEPEYIGGGVCVLMASAYSTAEDFDRLRAAIEDFVPLGQGSPSALPAWVSLPRMCSMREAMLSPRRQLAAEKAVGRTCAQVVSTCPPGIPLLVPGELITPAAVQMLRRAGIENISTVV